MFFRCRIVGGRLGTGTGAEMQAGDGSYFPVWVPVAKLDGLANVFPAQAARYVAAM